jgi:hypothetical protein
MDYRNYAGAADGIIDHAVLSIDRAAKNGKQVTIGVETGCNATPTKVTFCGRGLRYMESQLASTASHFAGSAGFGGFAIHDYVGYQALGP